MATRRVGVVLVLLGLALCGRQAFATVIGSPTGFSHDWGSIWTEPDYVPDADGQFSPADPGTHLVWDLSGALHHDSEDYKQQGTPVPSPDGSLGEYWDMEVLAFAKDAGSSGNYYFLAILSTASSLYQVGSDYISVGDLAINPKTNGSGTTADPWKYTADYGVKLTGNNQGQALANVEFGWGIDRSNPEDRNPSKKGNDGAAPSGYKPTDSRVPHYGWASNFTYTAASPADPTEATVIYQRLLGDGAWGYSGYGTGHDTDGPDQGGVGYGLDTYAIEVTIPKWRLASVGTIHDFSIASTCLNDGMKSSVPGGSDVPELPPTLLALALPAIGLLVRRAKTR